jgi:hypothetical protein
MICSEVACKNNEIWQCMYIIAQFKGIFLEPYNFHFQIKYQNLYYIYIYIVLYIGYTFNVFI